jgi:type I restriction enzyme S subunit
MKRNASWKETAFGELADFYDHKRIPLSSGERASRKGPYPYYGASGVIDQVDQYVFDGPYLLISEDGENLNSRKTPIAFRASGKFWVNNHAHIVRGKTGIAHDRYLEYLFATTDISGAITGAAQPKLSQANLRGITFRIPDYRTQEAILQVVGAYDDLIENNTRRIKILEDMAQMLYREWFVSFRFPGHEKVRMIDSELGPIPEEWRVGRLDEAVVLQRGFDLPTTQRVSGRVPIIAATGVNGCHNEPKVKGPGVVTGRSGSLGTVMLVWEDFWPLNTTLWVKEFRRSIPVHGYYLIKSLDFHTFNSGSAVPTLNRNDVHGLRVVLPDRTILETFNVHALPLLTLKRNLESKNTNLRSTRNLLLPKLISGEIPVEAADETAALMEATA